MEILYEDNHLIVLNKRPSEIVQGDKTGDIPMSEHLKVYLKEKYHKPGEVFVGVPHRLDRPVSGVVIFTRTSKALTRMNDLFRGNQVSKIYWAIVQKRPPLDEGILEHYLKKDEKKNKSFAYMTKVRDSVLARMKFRVAASSNNYHLLEVNLYTGRHHQIRCQLAKIGSPVKGDLKYGFDRSNPDGSISLHARSISFIHPVKNEPIIITAPPPDDNLWRALTAGLV